MKDVNCGYCMRDEHLDAFGIFICDLKVSSLILFREQSHKGRCIVASKFHVSEMIELTAEERNAFMDDVCRVAKAIHALFKPAKVNYGAYGDTGHHLHFHLVPKYTGEFEWGGTFEMNPKRTVLDRAAYDALAVFFMKHGPICSTGTIKNILKGFEKKGRIKVMRNPDRTKSGKPTTFMSEGKNQTVSVRWVK